MKASLPNWAISFSPGFSRVKRRFRLDNRFNGFFGANAAQKKGQSMRLAYLTGVSTIPYLGKPNPP
jgi:hypothetical protein